MSSASTAGDLEHLEHTEPQVQPAEPSPKTQVQPAEPSPKTQVQPAEPSLWTPDGPTQRGVWCNKLLEVGEEVRKAWKEKAMARVEKIKDDTRPN